jgi:hypothetical protein
MGFVFDPMTIASRMHPNRKCPWFHARKGGQDGSDTYWECDSYRWECDEHLSICNEHCTRYLRALEEMKHGKRPEEFIGD